MEWNENVSQQKNILDVFLCIYFYDRDIEITNDKLKPQSLSVCRLEGRIWILVSYASFFSFYNFISYPLWGPKLKKKNILMFFS